MNICAACKIAARERMRVERYAARVVERLPGEEWRDWPRGGYRVSNLGRVMSTKYGERLVQGVAVANGYLYVTLPDPARRMIQLHRAVARLFAAPRPGATEVDHIDRDKHNNRADNLRWVTHTENMRNRGFIGSVRPRQNKRGVVFDVYFLHERRRFKTEQEARAHLAARIVALKDAVYPE